MSSESHTEREARFARARHAADARAAQEIADSRRMQFLTRLNEAVHRAGVRVTEWENTFVSDLVVSSRPLSDPQRDCIDELRCKYEHLLK